MIINQIGAEFKYKGVTYMIGASVTGTSESEYEGLYGSITEIRNGKDKKTGNNTPDIYCSFEIPVLPCKIKQLEKRFSELYQEPKTIDDIILDSVIMAPEMLCPLDDLKKCRYHPKIYVLIEDWAVDGDHDNSFEIYTDYNDTHRSLIQKLEEEMENGCIPIWNSNEDFIENSTSNSYECYLDGNYCENHYSIMITTQKLCASDQFINEITKLHKTSSQTDEQKKG